MTASAPFVAGPFGAADTSRMRWSWRGEQPAATPASPGAAIAVDGLRIGIPGAKGAPDKVLVHEVNLALQPGQTHALVGESGSGKSLTALAMMRLLPDPVRILGGGVFYDGQDLVQADQATLRRVRGGGIAMVFQEPLSALNPVMTVGRQLREAVRSQGVLDGRAVERRVVDLLDLVRIPDAARRAHDYPHRLSGGMRQRVLIAMALASRPRVLIADEPTTALDATVQADMLSLLQDLQDDLGLAILLITHDLGVVADWASDVSVMYAGRVVESGPARQVLNHPAHPYTDGLLGARPGARRRGPDGSRPRLVEIAGTVPPPHRLPAGCAFAPRCALATAACTAERPLLELVAPSHASACFSARQVFQRQVAHA